MMAILSMLVRDLAKESSHVEIIQAKLAIILVLEGTHVRTMKA